MWHLRLLCGLPPFSHSNLMPSSILPSPGGCFNFFNGGASAWSTTGTGGAGGFSFGSMRWPRSTAAKLCSGRRSNASSSAASGGVHFFRRAALADLAAIDRALQPVTAWMWSLNASTTQKQAAGDLHVALLAALIEANEWPDTRLPYDLIFGMDVIGHVPDTGVFRPLPHASTPDVEATMADFYATNAAEVLRQRELLARQARAGHKSRDRLRAVHAATIKEVRKGLLSRAYSYNEMNREFGTRWRSIPRFLVEQVKMDGSTKSRPCDNAKRSGHNAATFMEETNPLCNVFIIAEMLRAYAAACDRAHGAQPSVPPVDISVVDLQDAYRHIPCRDTAFTAVAVWNPNAERVDYHRVFGLNFGLTAAVVQFSRLPAVIEMTARRHLLIPMAHYLDDMFPLDKVGVGQGSRSYDALIALAERRLGCKVHANKRDPPALLNAVLGVGIDLSAFALGRRVLFRTLAAREAGLRHELRAARDDNYLSQSAAQSMLGKWQFAVVTMASRAGKAALLPLVHRANGRDESTAFSPTLCSMADFLEHLTLHAPPRCVSVDRLRDRPRLLYTDASGGKPSAGIPPRVGAVLIDGDEVIYCAADVPPDIIQCSAATTRRRSASSRATAGRPAS